MSAVTGPTSSVVTTAFFPDLPQYSSACATACCLDTVLPPSTDTVRIDKKYVPGALSWMPELYVAAQPLSATEMAINRNAALLILTPGWNGIEVSPSVIFALATLPASARLRTTVLVESKDCRYLNSTLQISISARERRQIALARAYWYFPSASMCPVDAIRNRSAFCVPPGSKSPLKLDAAGLLLTLQHPFVTLPAPRRLSIQFSRSGTAITQTKLMQKPNAPKTATRAYF